jgi:hypothetical protein
MRIFTGILCAILTSGMLLQHGNLILELNFKKCLTDIDLSFLDGLDSKTLGKLPELDDTNMPAADTSFPDLESFVDLMDKVKKTEEPLKTPVTAVVKPVSSTPSTVAVVKASAKITPILITEIKPAVNTKPISRVKVLYWPLICYNICCYSSYKTKISNCVREVASKQTSDGKLGLGILVPCNFF